MITPERLKDLLQKIEDSLRFLDIIYDLDIMQDDTRHLAEGLKSAFKEVKLLQEANPEKINEAWDVKALHDRINYLAVTLKIFRNNLERAESEVNQAMESTQELLNKLEEKGYSDDEL